MNRRDLVLDLLDNDKEQEYVPAGFFVHFDESFHKGQPAIDKHWSTSGTRGWTS